MLESATTVVEMECWRELRDERGKLCARLDARRLLLELHRNHQWVVFDLREVLQEEKVQSRHD